MIHFFPIFSVDAENTEYGHALKRIGVEHKIIAGQVNLSYKARIQLFFKVFKLLMLAIRNAYLSLVVSRPRPEAVVVSTEVEAAVFGLFKFILRKKRLKIVLSSLIFTERNSEVIDWLRHSYYTLALRGVDIAIVHSRLEERRYAQIFGRLKSRFKFVPWGTHIGSRQVLMGTNLSAPGEYGRIVTAGRSQRDYATLFQALGHSDYHLRAICDYLKDAPPAAVAARVTVLQNCYGDQYLQEIVDAAIVVIPLASTEISAGQMVLIQSMGLGKAIIISDTPTVRDYVEDRVDAWLVPLGDASALHAAIATLMEDSVLRESLGLQARATFDARMSAEGHMRGLLAAIR